MEHALSEATEAAVSLIGPPEIVSALCRLRRQGSISDSQYDGAKKALFQDIEDMSVCNLTIPVVVRAMGLLEKHPLRTLDALHVASALEYRTDLFVSSDRRQLDVASESGLRVLRV